MKIVPDTSVIISGILSQNVKKDAEIIIPEFVMEELRAQASRGREIGIQGLDEIIKLREKGFKIINTGRRQTYEEIQLSKYGRIDALILDVAKKENAVLYTSDMIQAKVGEAQGVVTEYFKPYNKEKIIKIDEMLSSDSMSLHIKEGIKSKIKKGTPGNFELVEISKEPVTKDEIELLIKEILDAARYDEDSFFEDSKKGSTVLQLKDKRIAITRPPFSEKIEITVIRPVVKLRLEDYSLEPELKERLEKGAEGVIIAGPPGSGKSTLAASIADFFYENGKIVKTMESPRDLQVDIGITQYSKLEGSFENTSDMLLLVRPDYTIFDEIRKTRDFRTFSDMRLAGVGMIGVVHATEPIDAVQRFVGRVELGMIPHIIDTVIYVKDGKILKVYSLSLLVRTPTGMSESDLARPVVEIRDFSTGKMEYEIYTYGEENIIIPIKKNNNPINKLVKNNILKHIEKYDRTAEIDVSGNRACIKVDNDAIPILIGKKGKNIQKLEKIIGMKIDIMPKTNSTGDQIDFKSTDSGAYIIFDIPKRYYQKIANFYAFDEYIFSATVGKNGKVKVSKESDIGKALFKAILRDGIKVFI